MLFLNYMYINILIKLKLCLELIQRLCTTYLQKLSKPSMFFSSLSLTTHIFFHVVLLQNLVVGLFKNCLKVLKVYLYLVQKFVNPKSLEVLNTNKTENKLISKLPINYVVYNCSDRILRFQSMEFPYLTWLESARE